MTSIVPPEQAALTEQINAVLPQTQCRKCGFDGCRPYAAAIASQATDINRCPPGGVEGIVRLAHITAKHHSPRRMPQSIAAECGIERRRPLARIDESACIGCTLCIQACPVDAIIGAPKQMHAIIDAHCTGCDLCVEACPVDCIAMETDYPGSTDKTGWAAWSIQDAQHAQTRFEQRQARLQRDRVEREEKLAAAAPPVASPVTVSMPAAEDASAASKKALLQAAMQRARQKRLSSPSE